MEKIAITLPEAIEISGIGRTTFYELFKSGALKPRKHGSRTLIMMAELRAYIEALPIAGGGK